MQNYRLIAFDIDGTILDNQHNVCKRLKLVVAKLMSRGYLFTLVSARHPQAMLDVANQLGIRGEFIALNGSFITNSKLEIVYNQKFPIERISHGLKDLHDQIAINYYHEFDWLVENLNPHVEREYEAYGYPYTLIKNNRPVLINKMTLIGNHDALLDAKDIFIKDQSLSTLFSNPQYLEVMCGSISKFNALKEYASSKNITPQQIIAFGDGENDIPMLSQVGLGVAMGNAKDIVKHAAHDVAGNNDEEGVALYLEELIKQGVL